MEANKPTEGRKSTSALCTAPVTLPGNSPMFFNLGGNNKTLFWSQPQNWDFVHFVPLVPRTTRGKDVQLHFRGKLKMLFPKPHTRRGRSEEHQSKAWASMSTCPREGLGGRRVRVGKEAEVTPLCAFRPVPLRVDAKRGWGGGPGPRGQAPHSCCREPCLTDHSTTHAGGDGLGEAPVSGTLSMSLHVLD